MRALPIVTLMSVLSACGPKSAPPNANGKRATPVIASAATATPPSSASSSATSACAQSCKSYGPMHTAGVIHDPALDEISGLAASRTNPGVLYLHNDSGDSARFFAVDETGATLRELTLAGATAIDWEDIAVGPCGTESCVWLGDIGDNHQKRPEAAVYRVREPIVSTTIPSAKVPVSNLAYERFPFVYPDGRHDAETLLVHPKTGDVYVLSKQWVGRGTAYRFPTPLTPDVRVTLIAISDVVVPSLSSPLTAGDIHPCGDRMVLRSYGEIFEYENPPGAPFESIFARTPTVIAEPGDPQGEALAYRGDGMAVFTASEGKSVPLHVATCK